MDLLQNKGILYLEQIKQIKTYLKPDVLVSL